MYVLIQSSFPNVDVHMVLQLAGIFGFMSYMGGFAALQLGKLDGNGPVYALTNVTGAILVLISLASAFNFASMLIQISWIIIGCFGLIRFSRKRRAPAPMFVSRRAD